MKKFPLLVLITAFLLTSGCAIHMPQTPEEFRQMAPGAFMGTVVELDVDRPLGKVTSTYKKMAPKCLNKRVTTTSSTPSRYGPQSHTVVVDYKATVKPGNKKSEVYVQQTYVSGVKVVQKMPPGGMYLLVADATPAGKNKTHVKIYTATVYKNFIKAIESWSKGEDLCPDLTQ